MSLFINKSELVEDISETVAAKLKQAAEDAARDYTDHYFRFGFSEEYEIGAHQYWHQYRPRLWLKMDLNNHIDAKFKEFSENSIKTAVIKHLESESFIDSIIERINRKQLGAK